MKIFLKIFLNIAHPAICLSITVGYRLSLLGAEFARGWDILESWRPTPIYLYIYCTRPHGIIGRDVLCTLWVAGWKPTSNHIKITVWFFNHRGHPVNVPNQRTAHLFSAIPANDTKESMFRHWNFSSRGSNLGVGPLAPEASVPATELSRFPWVQWIQSSR